jgi:hypothetical protein
MLDSTSLPKTAKYVNWIVIAPQQWSTAVVVVATHRRTTGNAHDRAPSRSPVGVKNIFRVAQKMLCHAEKTVIAQNSCNHAEKT